jgi:hypothetical protein
METEAVESRNVGRRKLAPGEGVDEQLHIRVSAADAARWRAAAKRDGVRWSLWVRAALDAMAQDSERANAPLVPPRGPEVIE